MLSDDELHALIRPDGQLDRVTMLHPLTVTLDQPDLVSLLGAALERAADPTTTGVPVFETEVERQRCLDLLSWVRGRQGPVTISVYPSEEDGLDDLDGFTGWGEEGSEDDIVI